MTRRIIPHAPDELLGLATLAVGEVAYGETSQRLLVGDGVTPGGRSYLSSADLGNVANIAPEDMPVSIAQQAALDLKADLELLQTYNTPIYSSVDDLPAATNSGALAIVAFGAEEGIYEDTGTWVRRSDSIAQRAENAEAGALAAAPYVNRALDVALGEGRQLFDRDDYLADTGIDDSGNFFDTIARFATKPMPVVPGGSFVSNQTVYNGGGHGLRFLDAALQFVQAGTVGGAYAPGQAVPVPDDPRIRYVQSAFLVPEYAGDGVAETLMIGGGTALRPWEPFGAISPQAFAHALSGAPDAKAIPGWALVNNAADGTLVSGIRSDGTHESPPPVARALAREYVRSDGIGLLARPVNQVAIYSDSFGPPERTVLDPLNAAGGAWFTQPLVTGEEPDAGENNKSYRGWGGRSASGNLAALIGDAESGYDKTTEAGIAGHTYLGNPQDRASILVWTDDMSPNDNGGVFNLTLYLDTLRRFFNAQRTIERRIVYLQPGLPVGGIGGGGAWASALATWQTKQDAIRALCADEGVIYVDVLALMRAEIGTGYMRPAGEVPGGYADSAARDQAYVDAGLWPASTYVGPGADPDAFKLAAQDTNVDGHPNQTKGFPLYGGFAAAAMIGAGWHLPTGDEA